MAKFCMSTNFLACKLLENYLKNRKFIRLLIDNKFYWLIYMKVWIIVSVMFLMENSQVKIAETVNDSSRFFNTEKQCLNSLTNKMVDGDMMIEFFGGAFVTGGSVFQKIKQCMAIDLEEKQLKRFLREMK